LICCSAFAIAFDFRLRLDVDGPEGRAMSALQQVSVYAKMVYPVLGAILNAMVAYESRDKTWKLLVGVLTTLFFIGLAYVNIVRR
jgi:hypothetical protein